WAIGRPAHQPRLRGSEPEWPTYAASLGSLKVNRRCRGHIFGDLAENVEGGRVGGGGLALRGPDHDGHAVGQVVAKAAAVAIDAGVLHDPAIGDDKSIGKIEIGPVLAFTYRGRSDLLL